HPFAMVWYPIFVVSEFCRSREWYAGRHFSLESFAFAKTICLTLGRQGDGGGGRIPQVVRFDQECLKCGLGRIPRLPESQRRQSVPVPAFAGPSPNGDGAYFPRKSPGGLGQGKQVVGVNFNHHAPS